MAKINLDNEYYVESDQYNFTLKRAFYGLDKDGKRKENQTVSTIGYYGNVTDAVEEYIKHICEDGTKLFDGDIREYAEVIDLIAKNAVSALRDVLRGVIA